MARFLAVLMLLASAGLALAGRAAAAEATVELELATERGSPPTAAQKWLPVLSEAGFDHPTIRASEAGDRVEIVTSGTDRSPIYRVRGILTASGGIRLPSGQFSVRDQAALTAWVQRLKSQGPEAVSGKSAGTAFGLTPSQLTAVKKDLSAPVTAATKKQEPVAAVEAIAKPLAIPLLLDDDARKALAASGAVRDELQGFSSGTALAALVRPAGLVVRPRFSNGQLQYAVVSGRSKGENWPIGWSSVKGPGKLVPGLMTKEETQDVDVPLGPALKELEGRIKAPFVYDHNNIAIQRIDVEGTKVHMKAGKTFYGRVLGRVLSQAHLTSEVRVDDAGKPFIWITTPKP